MSKTEHKFPLKTKSPAILGWVIFVFLLSLLLSCRKEVILPDIPVLVTGMVTGISENHAEFHAKILTGNTGPVSEHGFVWDTTPNPTLRSSRIYLGPLSEGRSFQIDKTGDQIANQVYYVKSFFKTGNVVNYGNWVKFTSLGGAIPEIEDFEPASGGTGTDINIYGKYFSYFKNHVKVKVGTYNCWVIAVSDHHIKIRLPKIITSEKVKITVEISGVTGISKKDFKFPGPVIESIEPALATCYSQITVTGKNLIAQGLPIPSIQFKSTDPRFPDLIPATVLQISGDHIIIEVPPLPTAGTYQLIMKSGFIHAVSPVLFTAAGAKITSITPSEATGGTILSIKGAHLINDISETAMFLGDRQLEILEIYDHEAKAVVPLDMLIGRYHIRTEANCFETFSDVPVNITSPWEPVGDMPAPGLKLPVSFTLDNKIYIGLGLRECPGSEPSTSKDLWEYDPATNLWTKKANFPGEGRLAAVAGVIEGKAIVGMGIKSPFDPPFSGFWLYDPGADHWQQIHPLPPGTEEAMNFTIGNRFFCSSEPLSANGDKAELYEYDIHSDAWNLIGDLPVNGHAGFSANGKGYMIYGKGYYEFDPETLKWTRLSDLTEILYRVFYSSDEVIVLNPNLDTFLLDVPTGNLTLLPSYRMNGLRKDFTGIVLDHQFYIGLGHDNVNCLSDFIKLNLADLP